MDANILVLGVTSYISRFFLDNIHDSIIIGLSRSEKKIIKDNLILINNFDYSFKNLLEVLKKYKPDKIINFIGLDKPNNKDQDNFQYFYNANCQITTNLLEAVRHTNKYNPHILLIGSAAEYEISTSIDNCTYNETSPTVPKSFYGLTKKIQTEIGLYYSQIFKQKIHIIRPSNIIGSNMRLGLFISDILSQLKKGLEEIVVYNLSSVRDFIDIKDIVLCLNKTLELDISGEIINVSSGRGVTLRYISEIISNWFRTKFNKKIIFKEIQMDNLIKANFCILDNSKLIRLTGYHPNQDLKGIIVDILNKDFNSINTMLH